ncbi:hypothetical protein HPP92_005190 [Vanilla planifolia]|uniref:VQ domain-containing protein n=1 Tax=Vanilla planifolia TaxID=51239 RepID=A0A835RL84_VANPL|nr:hypothetical protein HPP92_005490 [Vanilla planifolia]KAG0494196.1 hypothetical protein HPP92_005190 [Vanilla planifolia]
METGGYPRGKESSSPNASGNSANSSSSSNNGGLSGATLPPKVPAAALPLTPKFIPKGIEPNPYPTTFVHADTASFKQVVQLLTGSAETAAKQAAAAAATAAAAAATRNAISSAGKATTGPKKAAFKLYERRERMKNLKMISPMIPSFAGRMNPHSPAATAFSPRNMTEILSPSILDLPSLSLSPVTPLIPDPFGRSPHPGSAEAIKAEEQAIAEKGFYFHPSPSTTPRDAQPPRLLPLFPVMSPRVSSAFST